MKIGKGMKGLLLSVALMCGMGMAADAREVPDMSRAGSIAVTMRYDEKVIKGGLLTIYQVGEIREQNGDFMFVLTADFAGSKEKLDDPESAESAKRLADYADRRQIKKAGEKEMPDGTAVFNRLQPGLYLAIQNEAARGYQKASPFLVTVPQWEENGYVYDVDASPKVELKKKTGSETPETKKPGGSGGGSKKPGKTLPQTGQRNWPVPVLMTAGIGMFLSGALLRTEKKEKHEK